MPVQRDFAPDIARVCHEANRAYCATMDDFSHGTWDQSADWVHDSMIEGVRFLCQNPEANPFDSHEAWLLKKERDGWVWGEIKDSTTKRHPCIRPWGELTPAQRMKDEIFHAIVRAMTP